ncbi:MULTISPECIES: hypothetical protein [unclassified Peribacillus]|jgi:hypothetical protein|uniref:hypothetical protein n=1 Tax=unclassified Peribacillus TaxID=2675266 RepID=UPI0019115C4C|nr:MULTISPECIES: hypothetical protein [unclassified Peribacillus]MBK5441478.1 hypothetical protein [Peribacillus sp. TH24]MBK5458588.1 hypothetical protein [Peribacillus sp. TH27]MBK5480494.1 hypothetical protein [Peribacillus sp. TH16]MBK5502001.1 hypothetical protein [Peribacillus sp. TH14]WMX58017.1 hypothetical protein RE409_12815 [Peribacillus sp. R9-11]
MRSKTLHIKLDQKLENLKSLMVMQDDVVGGVIIGQAAVQANLLQSPDDYYERWVAGWLALQN